MDPRHRALLVGFFAALMAVYTGWQIADSNFGLAALIAGLLLVIVIEWWGWLAPEAAICVFLIAGYVLGNRGFAQIMPIGSLPLPIGELGLALASALVIARNAVRRQLPFRWDALNLILLLWALLGAGRILWDVRAFGFYALRDFAMVYYCAFFYLLQSIARDATARIRLRLCLVWIFGLLPLIALIVEQFPYFFLTQLTLNGVPIFFFKGDLLATFLCSGFFLLALWAPKQTAPLRLLGTILAMVSLGYGLYLLSRAAMLGFAVGLFGCALARKWVVLRIAGLALVLGLILAVVEIIFVQTDIKQSRLYGAYEHAISIADISGSGSYESSVSEDTAGNNQFRTVWWRSIAAETLDIAPFFGLGFGYDLAAEFIQNYDLAMGDDFTARSPHNIVMTVFGRMGLIGAALWLTFMALLARASCQVAKRIRLGDQECDDALAYHAAAWVILISACFGVVLEGPMGAVLFWSLVGLAYADLKIDKST